MQVIDQFDMTLVYGNVYPYDNWIPFPWWNYQYIKWKLEHNDIIILHDTPYLIRTLELLFPYLNQNNFEAITLDNVYNDDTQLSYITPVFIRNIIKSKLICLIAHMFATIYSVIYYVIIFILYYIYDKFQIVINMAHDCIIIIWLVADYQDIFPDIIGDDMLRI